jgi:hypothetical protein
VTLCAVTSVNVPATIHAMRHCLDQIEFAECLLLTDGVVVDPDPRIRILRIDRVGSARAYSEFVLRDLAGFIKTAQVLIVQWDGFVLDAAEWDPAFQRYDYVGAPWPQFKDGHDVGNGGFSLRSKRLLEACRAPGFQSAHPEDVAICRINRDFLEQDHGLRFADRETAERFSFEREAPEGRTFGFHGVFNMIALFGADHFWQVYRTLDDRKTVFIDYQLLMKQLGRGSSPTRRRIRLTVDRLAALIRRRR